MKSLAQITGFLVLSFFATVSKADIIRCESSGYRYNTCSTNGYVSSVILRQQLSRSACSYGSSWGFNSNSIWVDKGCRANFETVSNNGYPPPGYGNPPPPGYGNNPNPPGYGPNPGYPPPYQDHEEQISCSSYGYGYNACPTSYYGQIVQLRIIRQLSNTACVYGQNYGVTQNSVWVDRGCAGIFRVITRENYNSINNY